MKLHLPKMLFLAITTYITSVFCYASTNDSLTPHESTGDIKDSNGVVVGSYEKIWYDNGSGTTNIKDVNGVVVGAYTYETLENGTVRSSFVGDINQAKLCATPTKQSYFLGSVSAMPNEYKNADGVAHLASGTEFVIGAPSGEDPVATNVTYATSGGIQGDVVTGDQKIVVQNGAHVNYLSGGAIYTSGFSQTSKPEGYLSYSNGYYYYPSSESAKVSVVVKDGGSAGSVIASDYVMSASVASYAKDENGYTKIVAKYAPSVLVTGAGTTVDKIFGGFYGSVDNHVSISVEDGATVTGFIQGGSDAYNHSTPAYRANVYVKSTSISIKGDETYVGGNIYGGGYTDTSGISVSDVGETYIEIAGGTVNGSVFGGGDGGGTIRKGSSILLSGGIVNGGVYSGGRADTVNEGGFIKISGIGTKVNGVISGGGVSLTYGEDNQTKNATVNGGSVLLVDEYTGDKSYKIADFTDIEVKSNVTFEQMLVADAGTTVEIADDSCLTLTTAKSAEKQTSYSGADISGGTLALDNAEYVVSEGKKLNSDVAMYNNAVLDLGGSAFANKIWVYGCTLKGAGNYSGDLEVIGGNLELVDDTKANTVTLTDGGTINGSGVTLETQNIIIDSSSSAGGQIIVQELIVPDNGTVTLTDGATLNVLGSLTMGNNVTFVLDGDYVLNTDLITVTGNIEQEGQVTFILEDKKVVVGPGGVNYIARFNRNYAKALTVSNWGVATASRAVVNAVRGQRSNTGCIADGKGTAWVAILGGNNDINGSDISLSGATLGADMQVGAASRVGIAMGYVEGEVRPSGLRQVDQEGSYIAAYGEHGLKKLSSTSCLSMDWVAAYGVTDSEGAGKKWEQDSVQLNSRVNWNKKVTDKLCMSVFGGLEYFASNSDKVDGVKTGSIQNLRGEIGVGARYVAWGAPAAIASYDEKGAMLTEARPGCEKLVLNGEIRYMNDMVRSNPVIRMNGLSGMGENPGRQGMGIEAGATYRIGERWSASVNYGFNTMEDSKEHRVNVGAAYTF